jgi:hypothetical protein
MNANVKAGAAALVAVLVVAAVGYVLLADDSSPNSSDPNGSNPTASPSRNGRDLGPPPNPGSTPSPGGGTPGSGPGGTTRPGGGSPSGGGDPRTTPTRAGQPAGSPRDEGPRTVTFRCLDHKGQPMSGVRIDARRRSGMPLQPAISDAKGAAHLGGLPSGETVSGTARHPKASEGVRFGPVTVGANTVVNLRFPQAKLGRLRGTIQDDTGKAVTEAELLLVNPEEKEGKAVLDAASLQLGPDGSFVVDVAAGRYAVSARGAQLSESDRAYVTVPPEGDSEQVLLKVTRQGVISGRLQLPPDLTQRRGLELDLVLEVKSGTERNPLTNVERRALKPDASLTFNVTGCHPGQVRMRLEFPQAGDNRVGAWVTVKLEPGQNLTGVVLSLHEVAVSVQGTVKDDEGLVVPEATVEVGVKTIQTDLNGRYALRGLDPGSVGIKATKPGHATAFESREYQGSTLTVDLVLSRLGSVQGVVTGSVVANVAVTLVIDDDGAVETYAGKTDASGRYRIQNVPPATYYVKAGPGVDLFDASGAPTVTVKPGVTTAGPRIELR